MIHLVDWEKYRDSQKHQEWQEENSPPMSGNGVDTADNPDSDLSPNLPPEAAACAAEIRKGVRRAVGFYFPVYFPFVGLFCNCQYCILFPWRLLPWPHTILGNVKNQHSHDGQFAGNEADSLP